MSRSVRYHWLSLILVFIVLAGSAIPVHAQNYSFQIPKTIANLFVNPDGSFAIEYFITFQNDPSASPIDFVDIGTPNDNYDLGTITADVDGKTITDIQKSSYITHGVALGLGGNEIPPGATGIVHIYIAQITGVLYPGTAKESESYASLQFSPNYFDSKFVSGSTDLTMTIYLPKGLTTQEPRYYPPQNWPGDQAPQSAFDDQGRAFYRWQSSNAKSSTEYIFGASFPARLVPAGAIVTPPPFTIDWEAICPGLFFLGFCGFFILIGYLGIVGARQRKLQYLPPKISMEGNGIKRGLTAVEAAIVMETPLDKILMMILFGLIKKNAARVTVREPLTLEAANPPPAGLAQYETDFLTAFQKTDPKDRRTALQAMMVALVKGVTEKMKGFSRKDTVAYYKTIIDAAWKQVETAATPDVKGQLYDQNLDWTMLDGKFSDRTRETFGGSTYIPVPIWWGAYNPGYHPASTGGASFPSIGPSTGGQVSLPTLPGADFAAGMVNGVQSFSAGVIGDLTNFTNGVTNVTNPPPPPSSGGSSGGGGRACACACACAGCACACAGGGR